MRSAFILMLALGAAACARPTPEPGPRWRLRFVPLEATRLNPVFEGRAIPAGAARGGVREYEVRLLAPDAVLNLIPTGGAATAVAPLASRPQIPARITARERGALSLRLRYEARLIDHMDLAVRFPGLAAGGLSVPLAAISAPDGERARIFVLRNGVLKAVPVTIVGEDLERGRILALAEAAAGELAAIDRIDALLDGETAEARP